MNKQNSPEKVVGQPFANAKREWHNLSKTHLASYAVGFQTPALVQPLTGNSTVVLDMDHAIQTNPTVTPVFDSMRVNVRAFFAPARLYCRGLIGNNFVDLDEIENIDLPYAQYLVQNTGSSVLYEGAGGVNMILPGSLLNRLGYPACTLNVSGPIPLESSRRSRALPSSIDDENTNIRLHWNMMPLVAYYDICARFLSNPYDLNIPFVTYSNYASGGQVEYLGDTFVNLRDIQAWVAAVRGYNVDVTNTASSGVSSINALFGAGGPTGNWLFNGIRLADSEDNTDLLRLTVSKTFDYLGLPSTDVTQKSYQLGLWPSLYMDDYATTYFDNEDIEDLMQTELGADVESYRVGQSKFSRKLRSILNGRKFDDWVEIHFGYKLKTSDHPIMVGADHFTLRFNDVFNQSADADGFTPLGASASRGDKGSASRRRISFTAQEPGFLFVIIDIVPYVTYSEFLPNWLDWQVFGSFPLPEYGGRAFQDLTIGDVVNTGISSLNNEVIGKQPIYYDFMTNRDTLGGIFNTSLLDTYTFKRKFDFREVSGGGDVFDAVRSTYMSKLMYDYAFPDWEQNGGENIFIKSQFGLRVLQPIPRQIIKNRI